MEKLSLDELGMVSGGTEINEDGQAGGRCPNCGALLKKVAGGYQCLSCPGKPVYTKEQLNRSNSKDKNMTLSGGRNTGRPVFDFPKYNA